MAPDLDVGLGTRQTVASPEAEEVFLEVRALTGSLGYVLLFVARSAFDYLFGGSDIA